MSNENFGSFFKRQGLTLVNKVLNTINLATPVVEMRIDEVEKNIDFAVVPKGTGAFLLNTPDGTAVGGNKRGANAIDLQTSRTGATQVASGNYSTCSGQTNTASGTNSMSVGSGNTASGGSSVAIGVSNIASNTGASAIGNSNSSTGVGASSLGKANLASGNGSHCSGDTNVSSGHYSTATGSGTSSFGILGRRVHGPGLTAVVGDTQFSDFMLRATTSSVTPVIATADGGAAGTSNEVLLSNNSAYAFHGFVVAKENASTNVAMWEIKGLIVRGANAAATTLVTSSVTAISNVPGWTGPSLSANTTVGSLEVLMTGPAAVLVRTNTKISTTEVIFA